MPYIGTAPSSELANLDINGQKLVLDADADTSITADTDDTIDIEIAGADDFKITANTFTAATGSIVALPDGAVATPTLTNTGDLNTGVYFPAADTVGITAGGTEQFRFGSNPIPGGSKNLVVNGNFTVSQRGTSFADPANNAYTMDRWTGFRDSTSAAYTVTQDTSGVFAAFGTDTALKVDVTTADTSIASDMRCNIETRLEAQNLQHLNWGNAAAKDLTLSFCFRSPKSGTHVVVLYAQDGTRHQAQTFTVASADTAEYFSLTFAGDTGGTINNDTGAGMFVYFPLCVGSSEADGTIGSWAAGQKYSASGAQNLLDDAANNIYIGLVQLEVGSVATDFAHEDIGTTIAKCQRYYVKWTTAGEVSLSGACRGTSTGLVGGLDLPVTMRSAPTMTWGTFNTIDSSASGVDGTLSTNVAGTRSVSAAVGSGSGYTDGNGLYCELKSGQTLQASAEL